MIDAHPIWPSERAGLLKSSGYEVRSLTHTCGHSHAGPADARPCLLALEVRYPTVEWLTLARNSRPDRSDVFGFIKADSQA